MFETIIAQKGWNCYCALTWRTRKYTIKVSDSNSREKQAILRQKKIPYSVLFFGYGVLQFCQKDKEKEEIL